MFGNPKGELRICSKCNREHDILRGTRCWCACGKEIRSKEYTQTNTKKNSPQLNSELPKTRFEAEDTPRGKEKQE